MNPKNVPDVRAGSRAAFLSSTSPVLAAAVPSASGLVRRTSALMLGAALALGLGACSGAGASDTREDAARTVQAIERATSAQVVGEGADFAPRPVKSAFDTTGNSFRVALPEGDHVSIPVSPAERVTLSSGATTIGLGLPLTDAAPGGLVADGTILYSAPSVDTAVQALEGGGARVLLTIKSAEAPAEYRFPLAIPAGATVQAVDYESDVGRETFTVILDQDGDILGAVDSPWAKDAHGNAVPTSYRLEGTTLVQHVAFNQGTAFPVVADPSVWAVAKCAATVVATVATNFVPAARLVKIAALVKKYGPKRIAKAIMAFRKGQNVGARDLKELAIAFLGVDSIKNNCKG